MTKRQAQKIYEKYNSTSAVTRCPNGRAFVRKLLDTYARAAVNLYGIISKAELAEIFNSQNVGQTNADEVFALLLPLVLKNKWYCFYKDYMVHYWAIENFDYADSWLREQGNRPRFIPEKVEFLKFENQYYESTTQEQCWHKLFDFVVKEWPNNNNRYRFYNDIKEISAFSSGINKVSELLDKYGLVFQEEKQVQVFFNLLMEAQNNTKLWSNKGYSPSELHKILDSQRQKNDLPEFVIPKRIKVGANDTCPCGSGKKYKKCCRLTEETKTAQLSYNECVLFYETWYGLMGFINGQKKIISQTIKPVYPNPVSDEQVYKVREVLWGNPELIDDYIDSVKLTDEKVNLLKSWRDHHKKGMFLLVDYKPEYAVAIGSDEQKQDRIYAVKGISRPLSDAMQRELPIQFETVLLPFKDKIIYDSFMSSKPLAFAEGAKRAFREMYENALGRWIITQI